MRFKVAAEYIIWLKEWAHEGLDLLNDRKGNNGEKKEEGGS